MPAEQTLENTAGFAILKSHDHCSADVCTPLIARPRPSNKQTVLQYYVFDMISTREKGITAL